MKRIRPLVTLPGKARGSVEKDGFRRQPADAAARGSEIFDPVVEGPSYSVNRRSIIHDRIGAPDISAAEVELQSGDSAAKLPIISGMTTENAAFRPDAVKAG